MTETTAHFTTGMTRRHPNKLHIDALHRFLDELGVGLEEVRSVSMDHRGVELTVYVLNEHGHKYLAPPDLNAVATASWFVPWYGRGEPECSTCGELLVTFESTVLSSYCHSCREPTGADADDGPRPG